MTTKKTLAARLRRYSQEQPSGCWEWSGYRNAKGYGRIYSGAPSFTVLFAHRAAWAVANGPIPPGMLVLHRCDNPPCVNPSHLALGTAFDNAADAAERGALWRVFGEANGRAKLTESSVRAIRERLASGAFHRTVAKEFGISRSQVSTIARGENWGWVA